MFYIIQFLESTQPHVSRYFYIQYDVYIRNQHPSRIKRGSWENNKSLCLQVNIIEDYKFANLDT